MRFVWSAVLAVMLALTMTARAADAPVPFQFTVDEQGLAGAPDRSALNQPLGPADRIVARDGHFYRVGADGRPRTDDDTRVRLFGISLSFSTNFPSTEEAMRLARQLRKAGFNAVRLHHMDFWLGRETDRPRGILTPDPYPTFNAAAVERVRNFIAVLAREGIYTNLNLYVSYRFRPEIDGLLDFDTPDNRMPIGASVHVYHPRMAALQETFARRIIEQLRLKDNPALAMVEIHNETSLLAAWMRKEWKTHALPSAYEPVLREAWNRWLAGRYGSGAAACRAWEVCDADASGVVALPTQDEAAPRSTLGSIVNRVRARWNELMPADAMQSLSGEALRLHDFLDFLVDTDRAYVERMRDVVREAAGELVPVTGTQMVYGGVLNFDTQAGMDYLDEHRYIDHPDGAQSDWSIRSTSPTGGDMDILLALSFRRDHTKPFVLSEYNLTFPNPRGAEIMPVVATVAALQDWDGLFFYDYLDADTWPDAPTNFALSGDWGKYALAGQSAQIFRQQWIEPLRTSLQVPLPRQARDAIALANEYGGLEKAIGQLGVTPADAWRHRVSVDTQAQGPVHKPQPDGAQQQAVFDARQGYLTLAAPNVRGVIGNLDSQWRGAPGLQARALSNGDAAADIVLTPLDGQPVAQSRHLLLTLGSSTVGTQPGSFPARPKQLQRYKNQSGRWTLEPDPDGMDKPSGSRTASAPAWLSRPALCVRWSGATAPAAIYPLDGRGRRGQALDETVIWRQGNAVAVDLSARASAPPSPWYEVVLPPGQAAAGAGTLMPDCMPGNAK
ncbi:cellulase family glycosylhydrolase [Bordetella genomosp. 13]|uniref:Uncharacterized protein n=1 Tax=Bordetella genomosp. 13 TaxID=463040 RepID=A0A1W6ZJ27_9BORD|nr:cellulase family glycosylhydrolase [Bordetella genomosp. 13]ARP97150.1 hypothetical protein CAL15_23910 [Bordetella genomosp. 13]